MAIPTSGIYTSKASYAFGLLSLFLLIQNGCAYEFIVGGPSGWSPSGSYAFNQWAESKRFQIQDSLGKFSSINYFLFVLYIYSKKVEKP